ncbi:MAG: 2-phosphosulfolactate phosphatase [Candidatus Heimdallarchaeota archaeon]|nr:2-phosphosulfolactate phosphatase [Candidatus Heimdallarchaeota archaeon]
MVVDIFGNEAGAKLASERKAIVVVVDVLRASTTIPTAMTNGLEEICVVREVADCFQAQKETGAFIMGERECVKLPGFLYGNSPVEIAAVASSCPTKKAIFTSSTGAKRVIEASKAPYLLIGSIINAKVVAEKILALWEKEVKPVVIIPAFTEGPITKEQMGTEDQIGSVLIARECLKAGIKLSQDILQEIHVLEQVLQEQTIEELLRITAHGKKLLGLNFAKDITFSANLNSCEVVPIATQETIRKLQTNAKMVCFRK